MEADRPADMLFLLDCMEDLSSKRADSRFAGRIDTTRCALTGMSFGGWSTAAALESRDPRVKAAILQCPSLSMSGSGTLAEERQEMEVPVMVQLGTEDTVIGEAGNEAGRRYVQTHNGPAYCVEVVRGGHVSFTSGDLYNPKYGNGIGSSCGSLTKPGTQYEPLKIEEQHQIINSYGLAFLNAHLRSDAETSPGMAASAGTFNGEYLTANHFGDEVLLNAKP
mmetsp:Transcript_98062/g.280593  ORF Transcript_98062/g.280593 Transcript_98062/m.280593 type:complete len:222 (+) Transcript_98062:448-1113(+)